MYKLFFVLLMVFLSSCSTKKIKPEDFEKIQQKDSLDSMFQINEEFVPKATPSLLEESKVSPHSRITVAPKLKSKNLKKKRLRSDKMEKVLNQISKTPEETSIQKDSLVLDQDMVSKSQIKIESEGSLEKLVGFKGRRPIIDPYRVGEMTKLKISYFGITAGYLTLRVLPFAEVNGRQVYRFHITVKSNDSFDWIYSVEDEAETFVDYEKMIPYTYTLKVKETKKVGKTRLFFDWDQMKATYWDKEIHETKGEKEKKMEWEIWPYTQNVFSVGFYFRSYTMEPGKVYSIPIANQGDNLHFKGTALRKEKVITPAGEFNTVVIKPEFVLRGAFEQTGDIYMWFTDDDRKFLVKLEAKIKIGTLKGEAVEIIKGNNF